MNQDSDNEEGSLWMKLSPEQQKELILADDEISAGENIISHEEVKKEIAKWFKTKP